MSSIWICECRCGQGHVVAAVAVDTRIAHLDDAQNAIAEMVAVRIHSGELEQACAICSNGSRHFKVRQTELGNLNEGRDEVRRLEARQMESIELARSFRARTVAAARRPIRPIDDLL